MALNTEVFSDRISQFKILTVILGVISLGFTADTYFKNATSAEAFLAIVIIFWILSIVWIVLLILGVLNPSDMVRKIDVVFHAIAAVCLIISGVIFFIWACVNKKHVQKHSGWWLIRALIGAITGIVNAVLYGLIAFNIFRSG